MEYDPDRISYEQLLDLFWNLHDPTAKEKAQYRSVIIDGLPVDQEVKNKIFAGNAKRLLGVNPKG